MNRSRQGQRAAVVAGQVGHRSRRAVLRHSNQQNPKNQAETHPARAIARVTRRAERALSSTGSRKDAPLLKNAVGSQRHRREVSENMINTGSRARAGSKASAGALVRLPSSA